MRRDVFQAIADPTRRDIIDVIAYQSLTLNSIAEDFKISRQAVSKHIKILTECGLIIIEQHGRERFCHAKLDKLSDVSVWIEQYRKIWEDRFESIDSVLEELLAKRKKTNKRK
jgi:DNA-binding transcriptional ArsR family regulator